MRRWFQRTVLFLPALLLTVTGCSEPSTDFPFQEVRYTLTGGVAGFDRALKVRTDGSYQVIEEGRALRSGQLAAAQVRKLKELLAAVDWTDLDQEYADPKVADSLYETLVVRTHTQQHEVRVGTGGTPPAVITALLAFLANELRELYRM